MWCVKFVNEEEKCVFVFLTKVNETCTCTFILIYLLYVTYD